MNTFLPYSDFHKSAKSLDNKRLGKQRVEVIQMLNKIHGFTKGRGWTNHPCTKMWSKHPNALVKYGIAVCEVWRSRGFKDTCLEKISNYHRSDLTNEMPDWLGREDFHTSHKSNLIQKFPEHYRPQFSNVPDNLEYIWPVI
ncbi:MAG: cytoplasmic protein [Proteobacteria bacterium]|nr:cytoplasmic protein [Pseudomonadota bacterium]NBP13128.1 cytoplasmic protein [bacterium]